MNTVSDEQHRPAAQVKGDILKHDFYVTVNLTRPFSDLNFFQSRAPMEHSFKTHYL